jgi:rhomboid family GlyGly-CTERM serine protease
VTLTARLTLALLAFCVLFVAAQLLQQNGIDLRLRSSTLADHAWYRLVTGHLVHTNWTHLGMNAAALLITLLLFPFFGRPALIACCTLWNALFISLGILLLFPDIAWYVGFSGIVHGLLMTGAIVSFRQPVARLLILLLLAKVAWEFWSGGDSLSVSMIEAPVVYESHLLGLVAGALAGLSLSLIRPGFLLSRT